MKVKVKQEVCIGCGACTCICPEVFSFNDDGYAQAITTDVEDDNEKVTEAAEGCPTDAIVIDTKKD
ncbi:MAG: ferredoxin [Bacilli bacterium]